MDCSSRMFVENNMDMTIFAIKLIFFAYASFSFMTLKTHPLNISGLREGSKGQGSNPLNSINDKHGLPSGLVCCCQVKQG